MLYIVRMIYHAMFFSYQQYLKNYSRKNRIDMTYEESLVWHCILKRDKLGYRFLRQKPMGRYILDFYCASLKLCIEIDGESHRGKEKYDQERDAYLADIGIKTMRISVIQVRKNLLGVAWEVEKMIRERGQEKIPRPAA